MWKCKGSFDIFIKLYGQIEQIAILQWGVWGAQGWVGVVFSIGGWGIWGRVGRSGWGVRWGWVGRCGVFGVYIYVLFDCFCQALFGKGDCALCYVSTQIRDFPNISLFLR